MSNKKVHAIQLQPIKPKATPAQPKKKRKKQINVEGNQVLNIHELDVLNFKNEQTLIVFDRKRNIYKETDVQFIKDIRDIIQVKNKNILNTFKKSQLTPHQYDEIHYRAKIHSKANTINLNSKIDYQYIPEYDKCKCGCLRGKGKLIPIFTDEDNLRVLGPGILLQFMFQRAAAALLFIVLFIYGMFSMLTNIMGNSAVVSTACHDKLYCIFVHNISDENKIKSWIIYQIQSWLGVVFCFFWIVVVKITKYFGEQKNRIIDEKLRSSSDYAIKVQNLPRQSYEQKQVIWHIEDLWKKRMQQERLLQIQQQRRKGNKINDLDLPYSKTLQKYKLQMKSIQIIYNMQFSRKMNEEIFWLAQLVDQNLIVNDGEEKKNEERYYVKNYEQYAKNKQKLKQTFILQKDLRKRFLNDPEFRRHLSTTCTLIEFHKPRHAKFLLKHFGNEKIGIMKQIKLRIMNFFNPDDRSMLFKGKVLKIQRAPEPSDILWENCEKPESLSRRVGIYFVQIMLLFISFGAIFGLTILKYYIRQNPNDFQDSFIITLINYGTSISLQIINSLLWKIMGKLLDVQYNHTKTQKIISLMNIVFILSSINVIALPILTNYTVNLLYKYPVVFGDEGLNSLAFDYHITLLTNTILKLFNFETILKFIVINIRWTRYKIIWHFYKSSKQNKGIELENGDSEVNKFYQGQYYDVAQNYIFVITNMLHTAFFCKLQPLIIFIMAINIVLFYYVNRIRLLRLCKIPQMIQFLVFDNALWMLGFIPLYYGGGSILLSYLQTFQTQNYPFTVANIIPSFICLGLGFICVTNPGGILNIILHYVFNRITCIDIAEIMGQYEGGDQQPDSDSSDDDQQESQQELRVGSKQKIDVKDINNIKQDKLRQKAFNSSSRFQSYYVGSNSLSLLCFEKVLKGQQIQNHYQELKIFCQSFFPELQKPDIPVLISNKDQIRKLSIQSKNKMLEVPESHISDKSSNINYEKGSENL